MKGKLLYSSATKTQKVKQGERKRGCGCDGVIVFECVRLAVCA